MGDSNGDGDGGGVDRDGSGAIPCPGRVPEQGILSLESSLRRWRCCGTFSRKTSTSLGFLSWSEFIGGGAMSEGTRGPTPGGGAARGDPRHQVVWPSPGPPLSLLWTPSHVGKNRNFRLCFVQFREYFLCNFSEIQKQQKIGTGTVASC
jgi:hypothetical protein